MNAGSLALSTILFYKTEVIKTLWRVDNDSVHRCKTLVLTQDSKTNFSAQRRFILPRGTEDREKETKTRDRG